MWAGHLRTLIHLIYFYLTYLKCEPVTECTFNLNVGESNGAVHSLLVFVFRPSSFLICGSCPRDVYMAPGPQRQTQEGHAAAGCVLRPPEEGARKNFPEAEIHNQTRQEETCQ